MDTPETIPETREERFQSLRAEVSFLTEKIAESRLLSAGNPPAAIALAARTVEAMLWAIHHVEIGATEEDKLDPLMRRLEDACVLPSRFHYPLQVIAAYRGLTSAELEAREALSSNPWHVCFAALARVGRWFYGEYLGVEIPSELKQGSDAPASQPILSLVTGREHLAERSGRDPTMNRKLADPPLSLVASLQPSTAQLEAAAQLGVPPVIEDDRTGMVLVLIPGGGLWMGASPGDGDAMEQERPRHRVRVKPFYLGVGPVLQREWVREMGTNPSDNRGERRPVDNVSWDDTQSFLSRTNEGRTSPPLRLPVESEWELAARGGMSTAYWWGPSYRPGWVNCAEDGLGSGVQETTEVGRFPPNPFGLFDVLGNVTEWCEDAWHQNYEGAPSFAVPRADADGAYRVLRGGNWACPPSRVRVSDRHGYSHNLATGREGFRCARDLT